MYTYLANQLYLSAGIALSCGVSQAAAVGGMIILGVKRVIVWVKMQRAEEFEKPILQKRLKNDPLYLKTLAWMMVPLAGVHLARAYGKPHKMFTRLTCQVMESPGLHWIARKVTLRACFPFSQEQKDINATRWGFSTFKHWREHSLMCLKPAETVTMSREDGKNIDGIWVPASNENAATIVLFTGRGGSADHYVKEALVLRNRGLNVLLTTMGGYPNSAEGTQTTEQSILKDARAAVDFAVQKTEGRAYRVVAWGMSMGAVLAIQAGIVQKGVKVIADQPFTKFHEVPRNLFWRWTAPFVEGFLRAGVDRRALNNVRQVGHTEELFVLSTRDDPLMNPETLQGEALDMAHRIVQRVRDIPGNFFMQRIESVTGHGNFSLCPELFQQLEKWGLIPVKDHLS